jgi:glycosyltransferase involved in cell wall biosynthesis
LILTMPDARNNTWAILTKARATYFKPLWEGFAAAVPADARVLLILPRDHSSEHPVELTTPVHERLVIEEVGARIVSQSADHGAMAKHHGGQSTALPSREAWRFLRAARPRGVIVHEYSPFTLTGLIYAKLHRVPLLVMTEVGRGNARFFAWKTRCWHAWWSCFANGIIAACPAARTPLNGRTPPSFPAYHAVDAHQFTPSAEKHGPQSPVIFAFSGQLIHRKGLDLFFQAAEMLRTQAGDVFRLRIIGGGDMAWAKNEAEKHGVGDLVEWAGFLSGDAMRDALGTSDVFVLPTRQDTYAVVVHEAACLGLPLIVSCHAGAAEALVQEGKNGFVIDPSDIAHFATKMRSLLDETTRLPMRKASRKIAEAASSPRRGAALWNWISEQYMPAPAAAATFTPVTQTWS